MSEDKNIFTEGIVLELKVYVHCKACERAVINVIRKIKGVETVMVDMNSHKAIVTGEFEPETILKKLKKKTGKRAEVLNRIDRKVEDDRNEKAATLAGICENDTSDQSTISVPDHSAEDVLPGLHMFSDENPNSCSIA